MKTRKFGWILILAALTLHLHTPQACGEDVAAEAKITSPCPPKADSNKASLPDPTRSQSDYVRWLEQQSMLYQAGILAEQISGSNAQWQHPYALPETQSLLDATVWFTAYPNATLTNPGDSILATLGKKNLWNTFQAIGIQAMHLGPISLAGGITGCERTPTIDGWFDRIGFDVDPTLGTDADYKALVATARGYGAKIISDIVPGHTGKGADFRLATMKYKDYPGLYTMVEIDAKHWSLLPEVPEGADSANLPEATVSQLHELGYIPGELERVLFSVPGVPVTGWDATGVVTGVDGKPRRWVYLHYFRPGQPTLNWLDPSFASNRLLAGDIVKTLRFFGAPVIRLDANGFLGIEPRPNPERARSEGHPLSVSASNGLAQLIRKLGGHSFQELNLGLDEVQSFSKFGPDLSYDFVTRTASVHALLTGDAEFLKLMLRLMDDYRIKPSSLIHAMQNHDEITYELVHFRSHANDRFDFRGVDITGKELGNAVFGEMKQLAIGPQTPYNRLSVNGLCTTYTGLVASALGIKDIYALTPDQAELVKKGHLLMAMYNAMQPGVFAISGWDLVGALPLAENEIQEFLADRDYRWINRGAYDIVGDKKQNRSFNGLPKARALYGPVPTQLEDPRSFAAQLKRMLAARAKYKLADGERIAQPRAQNAGVVALVHRLQGLGNEMTVLNFSQRPVTETFALEGMAHAQVFDLLTEKSEGTVAMDGTLKITLGAFEGKAFLLK
jgi:trehalose synthase